MSLLENLHSRPAATGHRFVRLLPGVFALTVFLSAFMLFGVQPMFTKMVLPTLGGSPAVWSIAMVFFQTLLLAGYLYAHLSTRWLSAPQALATHGALVAASFLLLPLSVSQLFGAAPEIGQAQWLIAVFGASVGLPFFVLAASAPLLQAWFARSGHPGAANPYGLYVASNLGSFCALIAYPLAVEPLLPLRAQTLAWMVLFAALACALCACGLLAIATAGRAAPSDASAEEDAPAPSWRDKALWTGLAAVPSGLLVAATAHLSTDVASAPLLWVLPLALFLLTFVLCFSDRDYVGLPAMATAFARTAPFAVMSLIGFVLPLSVQFAVHLGLLFLAAMICHRTLYRMRPAAGRLTEFYLWMSFGGMLGGLFTGLAAPLLFDTIVEYRLLLIAALLCLPAAASAPAVSRQLPFAAAAVCIGAAWHWFGPDIPFPAQELRYAATLALGAGFLAIIIFNRSGPIASAGAAAAAFLAMSSIAGERPEAVTRSFFGVNYVRIMNNGEHRALLHGSTIHGAHRLRDLDGKPMRGRPLPTSYYHDDGAINLALTAARATAGGKLGDVAVLGLGIGAMACQSAEGERWAFFEIDREVEKLARRSDLFPFLSACTPDARVVIGDARLTLRRETVAYDVIILDAFSSDAVPAHLLTREAFEVYAERLKPGGVLIAHVSNRYMDLRSVAEAAGLGQGFDTASAAIPVDPANLHRKLQLATPTTGVAMSRNPAYLDALLADRRWRRADDGVRDKLWTDDYANILGAMIRHAMDR